MIEGRYNHSICFLVGGIVQWLELRSPKPSIKVRVLVPPPVVLSIFYVVILTPTSGMLESIALLFVIVLLLSNEDEDKERSFDVHTFNDVYEEYRGACCQLIDIYRSETSSCGDAVRARMNITQKRLSLLVALRASDGVLASDAFQLIELEQELSRVMGLATSLYPNLPKSLARYLWRRARKRLEYKFAQWLEVCEQRAGIAEKACQS